MVNTKTELEKTDFTGSMEPNFLILILCQIWHLSYNALRWFEWPLLKLIKFDTLNNLVYKYNTMDSLGTYVNHYHKISFFLKGICVTNKIMEKTIWG